MNLQANDVESIYARFAPALERILTRNLTVPQSVVEESCQVAWAAFVERRGEIDPGRELGWLATTATRAALRILKAGRRDLSLDDEQHREQLAQVVAISPSPERAFELRERLAEVRRLPLRQQRMVWLHGLGYEYTEIAGRTGDSRRTVERQLRRAKYRLSVAG